MSATFFTQQYGEFEPFSCQVGYVCVCVHVCVCVCPGWGDKVTHPSERMAVPLWKDPGVRGRPQSTRPFGPLLCSSVAEEEPVGISCWSCKLIHPACGDKLLTKCSTRLLRNDSVHRLMALRSCVVWQQKNFWVVSIPKVAPCSYGFWQAVYYYITPPPPSLPLPHPHFYVGLISTIAYKVQSEQPVHFNVEASLKSRLLNIQKNDLSKLLKPQWNNSAGWVRRNT